MVNFVADQVLFAVVHFVANQVLLAVVQLVADQVLGVLEGNAFIRLVGRML